MPAPDADSESPRRKSLRFSDVDEYIEVIKYDANDMPTTPTKQESLLTWSDSSPSSSSDSSVPTPDISDEPLLHVAIRPDTILHWDMAKSPESIEGLEPLSDQPAAVWRVDRAPLTTFQLSIEGIYKWTIEVTPAPEEGRTYASLGDLVAAIWESVSKNASRADVEALPPYTRSQVLKAREARCAEFSLDLRREPLRRMDFLLNSRRFLGVTTSSETRKFILHIGIHEPRGT